MSLKAKKLLRNRGAAFLMDHKQAYNAISVLNSEVKWK